MKLKEKILITAVELFNANGISSTSPNQIANALNISAGNLTYHYKTKSTLVKAVYEKMYGDTIDFLELKIYMTLADFRQIMIKFRDFKKKYRFFFEDIAFIIRNYPEVGQSISEINLKRFEQSRLLFHHFIETGRMIPEQEGIHYDKLLHNIWTVATFWDIQSLILAPAVISNKPIDMVDMSWYMILPFLTKKGKEEYNQINDLIKTQ